MKPGNSLLKLLLTNKLNVNMSIQGIVDVGSLFQSQKQTSSSRLWCAVKDVIRKWLAPLTSKYFSEFLILEKHVILKMV